MSKYPSDKELERIVQKAFEDKVRIQREQKELKNKDKKK